MCTPIWGRPGIRDRRKFPGELPDDRCVLERQQSAVTSQKKMWISGYHFYQTDVTHFDAKLTSIVVPHTLYPMTDPGAHTWTSGWVPAALAGLNTLSHCRMSPAGLTSVSSGTARPIPETFRMNNFFRRLKIAWSVLQKYPVLALPDNYWTETAMPRRYRNSCSSDTGAKIRHMRWHRVYDSQQRAITDRKDAAYSAGMAFGILRYDPRGRYAVVRRTAATGN